jgi:membrane protein DedA with SNARE-associated domain
LPIPADLLVVMVGAEARESGMPLLPAWILLAAATTIGASLLYTFTRWVGPQDIVHYGNYIGLTPARLESATAQLQNRGQRAILVARLVPGLRLAIVVVCGILDIRPRVFVPSVAVGALAYVAGCLALGYLFGSAVIDLLGQLVFPLGLLEPVIGTTVLLIWLRRARRRLAGSTTRQPLSRASRLRAGAIAGVLAIAGASMIVNILLYIGGPIAAELLTRGADLQAIMDISGGLGNVVRWILTVVLFGVVWGSLYGLFDRRYFESLPDWLHGLVFAAIPFASTLLTSLLAYVARGQELSEWLFEGLGELVRWALYGVLVGLIYPIFRARRASAHGRGVHVRAVFEQSLSNVRHKLPRRGKSPDSEAAR